ncbi:MAG: hypothetical protein ABI255_12990 [Microbacteriaceae bacterium]
MVGIREDEDRLADGFTPPRGRGTGAFTQWLQRRLPNIVVRHALLCGWIWLAVWLGVALLEELVDLPAWIFAAATVVMVIPALGAAAICLWATPRDHLKNRDSVLGHFFGRFLTVVFGLLAWTLSIVIGASISSTIQLIGNNHESEVVGTGFKLALTIVPFVATLLWMGLIIRCAWFLARLRGWRARPAQSALPQSFLEQAPRVRAWLTGLAHPGLLVVAGVLSVISINLSVVLVSAFDIVI